MRGNFFRGIFDGTGGAAPEPSPSGGGIFPQGARGIDPGARGHIGAASADPIASRLPSPAAALYRRLSGEQAEITAAANDIFARRQALRNGRALAVANLDGARAQGSRAEPHSIAHFERELAGFDAELQALDEREAALAKRRSALASRLAGWVRSVPGALPEHDQPVTVPKLGRGETRESQVVGLRERIAELRADRHAVDSAPWPSAIIKQRMRAQISGLAEHGRPNVLPAIEIGRPVGFATSPAAVHVASAGGTAAGQVSLIDAAALIAWLDQGRLIAALDAEIDQLSDDEHALSPDARRARLKALAADILEVERIEEAVIEAAEVEGIAIRRRDDMDPRACLGLADTLPQPRS